MADLPILFSAPMVRGLIREVEHPGSGKTQTRRALTLLRRFGVVTEFGPSDTHGYDWHFRDKDKRWHDLRHEEVLKVLPWAVGDRLWVRETHYRFGHWEEVPGARTKGNRQKWMFVPDRKEFSSEAPASYRKGRHHKDPATPAWHKRLARFMPKAMSRLTLAVSDVRVQRLQKISAEDAIAEGIEDVTADVAPRDKSLRFWKRYRDGGWNSYVDCPIQSYASLWTQINGEGSWESTPWIVALTFTVERRNIDAIGKGRP